MPPTALEVITAVFADDMSVHATDHEHAQQIIDKLGEHGYRIAPPTDLATLEVRLTEGYDGGFGDLIPEPLHNVDVVLADGTSLRVSEAEFGRGDDGLEVLRGYEVDESWQIKNDDDDTEIRLDKIVAIEI